MSARCATIRTRWGDTASYKLGYLAYDGGEPAEPFGSLISTWSASRCVT